MESFKVSRSRYRKVYGLPTLRGLALGAILLCSLWFAINNNSATERWLFLLMILLILVHLTESSQPFRHMTVQTLPFDPPFEGEIATIPVQITNQTVLKLDIMSLRFDDSDTWTEVPALGRQSSTLLHVTHRFSSSGAQSIPRLVLRTYPKPKLFRYWRIIEPSETTFVLPAPIDHYVLARPHTKANDDAELIGVEQILDERLLPQIDQKLFLKTGLPFRRVHQSMNENEQIAFVWSSLDQLSHERKGQQFSYWIKSAADLKKNFEVAIDTPFMKASQNGRSINWRHLKTGFAKWFYAQT